METRKISDLRRHPMNAEIYGDVPDAEFVESIREKGVLTPIIVTSENRVISGHRRVAACKQLGISEVPVDVRTYESESAAITALIHSNRQRAKTNEQRAREAAALEGIEREEAKRRQGTRTDIPETVPEGSTGDSRDKIGAKVGWSGPTAEKAVKTIQHIDTLKAAGKKEEAEELVEALNENVAKAYRKVPREQPEEKPKAKATFNRTNDNIKWAKWTWNPVTGCKHGCDYCYAREIAQRFNGGFNPTFHEDRLGAPDNTRPDLKIEGGNAVFVCSMADLFGTWVPNDWIWPIMQKVEQHPEWLFLFLTKNPARYESIQFPDNAWAGATVDTQKRVKPTQEALRKTQASVRFVSCEPLLEPVVFDDMSMIDWLIIGARSKTQTGPEFQPQFPWVEALYIKARSNNIPIYIKDNLTAKPQEYPSKKKE
jgi:protein gp37/ParB-like chromosome segregation protein Spo0J